MARERGGQEAFVGPVRRLVVSVVILFLLGLFVIWRIDSPRVERLRIAIIDQVMPVFDWALVPVAAAVDLAHDFRSYQRLYEENQELRRQLQQMKAWKEAALQLEQENARLLDLNKVRLDPRLTFITGVVLADSGSPFRQTVLINIGGRDGVQDGWPAMDGLGLVGRISGVGRTTARVILLTDPASRVPALIQPSGQRALVVGDNTAAPLIEFVEDAGQVRPGDRVVTSGSGRLFPPGLLIGQVARDAEGRLRILPAADYGRLEFLRVLRVYERGDRPEAGLLIIPAEAAGTAPSAGRVAAGVGGSDGPTD